MAIDIGISEDGRRNTSEGLATLLADTYALALLTQNFHWNVTGVNFPAYHALFGDQYDALAAAVDEIAERIRSLGFAAPASFKAFAERTSIVFPEHRLSDHEMVAALNHGHETVIRTVRKVLPGAQAAGDEGTADFLIGRLEAHEKAAWFLRSTLPH